MASNSPQAVVAGHICLDIIPQFPPRTDLDRLLKPGTLTEIGPAYISTGGAVSNTGLALHRLGIKTRLMGKVGRDLFGSAILSVMRGYSGALADGMLIDDDTSTSYTLVINPPDVDRSFLHAPGANDTFAADDIPYAELDGVRLLHFGYPPIMRRFYSEDGAELEDLFRRVKQRGVATSLDMAQPDPNAPAGQVDWHAILNRTLPYVDVFLPSLEEILFMLDRPKFEELTAAGDIVSQADQGLLYDLTGALLAMQVAVAGIKLGDRGLFVRTTEDDARLEPLRNAVQAPLEGWTGRGLHAPCFRVDVVGTTGCGDSTIAGFLAGLLHGCTLEETLTAAVGVGAFTAERVDATSGVPRWEVLQERIDTGWEQHADSFAD